MKLDQLIGKTIKNAQQLKHRNWDDTGYILLEFTDDTKVLIESGYDEYTGESVGEYPTLIKVKDEFSMERFESMVGEPAVAQDPPRCKHSKGGELDYCMVVGCSMCPYYK